MPKHGNKWIRENPYSDIFYADTEQKILTLFTIFPIDYSVLISTLITDKNTW